MLSISSRYILRAHVGPFLFGSCTVMFIFVLQFLMNYMNMLVGKGLGAWVIIQLISLNLAWMLTLAIPMGVLVSSLMAFGNLSGANEVTILKSSGVGLWRMMRPSIISGALIAVLLFWFNDRILPEANHRAKTLMNDVRQKKPMFAVEAGEFSSELEGYSILARNVDSSRTLMYGVTMYDYTKPERLNIISADSGVIAFSADKSQLVLTLHYGEIHQVNYRNYGDYRKVRFDKHVVSMNASGFVFQRTGEGVLSRSDREMSIAMMQVFVRQADTAQMLAQQALQKKTVEHVNYLLTGKINTEQVPPTSSFIPSVSDSLGHIQQSTISQTEAWRRTEQRITAFQSSVEGELQAIKDQQLSANRYLVEIHKKYAIPAACFVFVFVGCPLGIIVRRGNFGISAAISLAFYIVYWACLIGGEKLADRGVVSPTVGMWFANGLIGTFGIFLTIITANDGVLLPRSVRNLFFHKRKSENYSRL